MTDRELLQQMIDRIGKEPRAVKFDENDNLVELNLAGLDLEEIPIEFYSFPCLRVLVLGEPYSQQEMIRPLGNHIQSLDPAIGQCFALEELWLDYNHIQTLPEEINHLPNLRVLRFDHNNLGQFPPLLLALTHLETLWLDGNGILDLPDELSSLDNLKSLTLNANQTKLCLLALDHKSTGRPATKPW